MQLCKILLLILLLPAMSATAAQPVQTIISGWELTCDNSAACQSRSTGRSAGLNLSFFVSPGQENSDWLRIESRHRQHMAEEQNIPLSRRLLIDNQPFPLHPLQDDTHTLLTDDAASAQQLLTTLSQAKTLSTGGPGKGSLSLTALPSVLEQIRQIQSSAGSGLSSSVTSPVTLTVTAPPPAPVTPLSDEETTRFVEYAISQISSQSCPLAPVYRQIKLSALSDSQALLLISCESAAYNTFFHAYSISRQPPFFSRRLEFRLPFVYPQGFELSNVSYDAEKGELSTVLWGRAQADCGVQSHWQYDGHQFVLKLFTSESSCDRWRPASDWPVLWSADPAEDPATAGTGF